MENNKFKIGDKVICIDGIGRLTKGKVYIIVDESENIYILGEDLICCRKDENRIVFANKLLRVLYE